MIQMIGSKVADLSSAVCLLLCPSTMMSFSFISVKLFSAVYVTKLEEAMKSLAERFSALIVMCFSLLRQQESVAPVF